MSANVKGFDRATGTVLDMILIEGGTPDRARFIFNMTDVKTGGVKIYMETPGTHQPVIFGAVVGAITAAYYKQNIISVDYFLDRSILDDIEDGPHVPDDRVVAHKFRVLSIPGKDSL